MPNSRGALVLLVLRRGLERYLDFIHMNTKMSHHPFERITLVRTPLYRTLLCLLAVACCSCSDDEPRVTVRTIPGTITQIDAGKRRLTLRYVHEKSGAHREVEGDVLPDTEIFINGKLSPLSDIKIGERAIIQGRIEKSDANTRIFALKIDITRDESVSFGDGQSGGG